MKIKIDKPCNENWNEMTPDEKGRFCNKCAKSVIDFSILSDKESIDILSSSKGEVCGRVTSSQLSTPLIYFPEPRQSRIPYSKIAANLFFVASAFSAQSCTAQNDKPKTEKHYSLDDAIQITTGEISIDRILYNHSVIVSNSTFNGIILSPVDSLPIHNAKVEFFTLHKVYTAYTDSLGHYTLEIPQDAIKAKNVIRTSFQEIKRRAPKKMDTERDGIYLYGQHFMTQGYILTLEQLTKLHTIVAQHDIMIAGGMRHYIEPVTNPIVLQNGIEVDYKEFEKAQRGQKSSCNLANKEYYYFEGAEAIALYGQKAVTGLYLFF